MEEVAYQATPDTALTDPTPVLATGYAASWQSFASNSTVLVVSAERLADGTALSEILVAIQRLSYEPGPISALTLVEGWPPLPDNGDTTSWQNSIETAQDQFASLIAVVDEILPDAEIDALPLASTLSTMIESIPALSAVTDDALLSLAGIVSEIALSDTAPSTSSSADLPKGLVEHYADIVAIVWSEVGGSLTETGPEPVYLGTSSNDLIDYDSEVTRVDGGDGTDTLAIRARAQDTIIRPEPDGTILIETAEAATALTLVDVERIAFDDGTLAFDKDGLAGQAYRLYQACFDRTPDADGLGFWIKQLDSGAVTLSEVADLFIESEEFENVYGPPEELADVHYLALLYANVLDRAPDADGFAFWRDEQDKGVTRAEMLVFFSESVENIALVAPAVEDGIWYV